MELKTGKMKQVIHYIIDKCQDKPNFGKTVLYKLMYFSDFNHYEIYETLITNETYIKRLHGPIPDNFELCSFELKLEGKIKTKKEMVYGHPIFRHFSLKEPDTSLLTKEEIEVIDKVIDKHSDKNAGEISHYSHGDIPWRIAKFRENLNPESVFYRDDEYSVREYDE